MKKFLLLGLVIVSSLTATESDRFNNKKHSEISEHLAEFYFDELECELVHIKKLLEDISQRIEKNSKILEENFGFIPLQN